MCKIQALLTYKTGCFIRDLHYFTFSKEGFTKGDVFAENNKIV